MAALRGETMTSPALATRLEEYWWWFAVALFVLVTLDMLTTMYAVWAVGPAAEANPLVRVVLERGMLAYTAVNLVAAGIAIGGFASLVRLLETTDAPYDRYVEFGIQVWLGTLIGVGLFVFANNLTVVVHGRSLLL